MNSAALQLLPTFCEAISSMSKSWKGQFWFLITTLGWKGWLAAIFAILVWTVFEIFTGHGQSANGLSWRLNIAVGSLTFAIFQAIIGFLLSTIFGDGIYCLGWPLLFHLIPFLLTGAFLRWIGFWVY